MVISNLKIGTSYFFTLLKEFAKENIRYLEGLPVTMTAQPETGGVWAGWSDGVMEQTRIVEPGTIDALNAVFR